MRCTRIGGVFRFNETNEMKLTPPLNMLLSVLISTSALAATDPATAHHARGTFTVSMAPLTPAPAKGLSRYRMEKQLHGGIEGTSKGEMFSGGDPSQGAAGYVAIEVFTGTVDGRQGSFALQHLATMSAAGQQMTVVVVPGSGTGALKGITGTFTIKITGERHDYDLAYTLSEGK
jgi:hypothetical protein